MTTANVSVPADKVYEIEIGLLREHIAGLTRDLAISQALNGVLSQANDELSERLQQFEDARAESPE